MALGNTIDAVMIGAALAGKSDAEVAALLDDLADKSNYGRSVGLVILFRSAAERLRRADLGGTR